MNILKKDQEELLKLLNKHKKSFFRSILLLSIIVIVSLTIVVTQLFYPYHTIIGVVLYFWAFIILIRRIYFSRREWNKLKTYVMAKELIKKEKRKLIAVIVLMIVVLTFITIRPFGENPFKNMNETALKTKIADDAFKATAAMDYLESSGNTLLETLRYDEYGVRDTDKLKSDFDTFLRAVAFSESLTDTHRYFDKISYQYSTERSVSFIISYSLYVKKYELLHRVFAMVDDNEQKQKILNEHMPSIGRDRLYTEMIERFYLPETRLRINAGRFYLSVFDGTNDDVYGGAYGLLKGKAVSSYAYLFENFDTTVIKSGDVAMEAVRTRMFDSWFPVQKETITAMGHIILSERGHQGLIGEELINDIESEMLPGDIMLQRRNWHLSNVGIPGFWTHIAIYTGSIRDMDNYFASEFPYQGFSSMSEYIEHNYPKVWDTYSKGGEEDGINSVSVIEAMEPGVILQTLKTSANADFLATLRPDISKADKMQALFRSFSQFGKLYDYNFDFDTKDKIVCSELIYDAYYEHLPEKDGLIIPTSIVNGRKVVAPSDVAIKFKAEKGTKTAELLFVNFIQGNEKEGTAFVSDEDTFLKSVEWSKFSFLQ